MWHLHALQLRHIPGCLASSANLDSRESGDSKCSIVIWFTSFASEHFYSCSCHVEFSERCASLCYKSSSKPISIEFDYTVTLLSNWRQANCISFLCQCVPLGKQFCCCLWLSLLSCDLWPGWATDWLELPMLRPSDRRCPREPRSLIQLNQINQVRH
jgi:hypothetical protein